MAKKSWTALLAVGLVGAFVHAAAAQPRLVDVHIVSRVNTDGAPIDDTPKRARADVGVTLYSVLVVEEAGKQVFYSDAPRVRVRGRSHAAQPMSRAPAARLSWYKIEPATENMSNTASGQFRFEAIDYGEVLVKEWESRAHVIADVHPTLTSDQGNGVGTMRYKLVATLGGVTVATPGRQARRGRGSGGLDDRVHRVSLRRDDTFLGVMTEMFGQPYIWASAGTSDRTHQSERLEGADCADLMVYGARRKGYAIPYTWSGGLGPYTRTLASGAPGPGGVYVDSRGKPLPFPRAGDLVLFPRHVGALVEDRGVPGVLDQEDVMMHTLFASPREQPMVESGYANNPVKVLRWKRSLDR